MDGGIRVLYVDGDAASRSAIIDRLEGADDRLQIDTAPTAAAALDCHSTEHFDCILAVSVLPDTTGLGLLDQIHATGSPVPFVLLARDGSEKLASDAIRAGVADYIPEDTPDSQLATRILEVVDGNETNHDGVEPEYLWEAINTAHTPLVLSDPNKEDNPMVYVNDAFTEMTGYPRSELLGRNCRLLQGEQTDPKRVAQLRDAIDQEKPVTVELRNYRKDGTMFWNQLTVVPVYDTAGKLIRYLGTQQDITDRKQRAEKLKRYERLVEHLPIGVIRTTPGPEGTIRLVNEAMVDLFEADSKETIRNVSVAELYADPADRARFSDRLEAERVIKHEELLMETLEGKKRWCDVSAVAVSQNGETVFEIAIQDITERKRYEYDRTLFKQAVEQAGNSVLITRRDGTIEYVNPAFEQTTGYEATEILGRTPRVLKSGKHDDAFYEELWETILAEEIWVGELINRRKSGRLYYASHTIAPITDESGEITHFVGIQSDITEQKLREKRLSELTRILRHNLRNRANALKGHAEVLEGSVPDENKDNLSYILDQADSLASTTAKATKIRQLINRDIQREDRCNLQTALTDLQTELEAAYPAMELTLDSTPIEISIDTESLQSVVRELVENAVVHNDQQPPQVTVTVDEASSESGQIGIHVADNGPGIHDQERVAVRVGPENPLEHGSGIGLSHVHLVVTEHGGEVTITDNEPRGSVVTISLPPAE